VLGEMAHRLAAAGIAGAAAGVLECEAGAEAAGVMMTST